MLKGAKSQHLLLILLVFAVCTVTALLSGKSQALHLQNHSIKVSSALVGAVVNHDFQFVYPSTAVVGSVVLQYCDSGALLSMPCNAPAGLNVSGAVLVAQSGNINFSIDGVNSTSNKVVLTRAPVAGLNVLSTYSFSNITNPSTANATTYVRISTYPTTDATGTQNDEGAVAFATVNPFDVNAFVPPFLKLCVGINVTNDCSSVSGDNLNLGVLSDKATKHGTSEFSAGTNSPTGYNIYALGTTMTSGNNIIPAINPANISRSGSSQFGINLRANTAPSVGRDPQGIGTAAPLAGYNSPNLFSFRNGDNIAGSSLSTDFSKMTVSYVVNIGSDQPPGIYSTTITYMGVAGF
jgi:hypothetical protein